MAMHKGDHFESSRRSVGRSNASRTRASSPLRRSTVSPCIQWVDPKQWHRHNAVEAENMSATLTPGDQGDSAMSGPTPYGRGNRTWRCDVAEVVSPRDRDIAEVLAGTRSYDDVDAEAQTLVRAVWEDRIVKARDGLNLAADFRAAGITGWVCTNEQGRTPIEA